MLTGRVDTVLVGDHLPELGTDLVTALASLDVDEFALRGTRKSEDERECWPGGEEAKSVRRRRVARGVREGQAEECVVMCGAA